MALHGFAEGCLGIPGGEKPSGRMRIEAVRLLKSGIPFFIKVKSSSQSSARIFIFTSIQSLKFGAGQLNVRTSTYGRSCLQQRLKAWDTSGRARKLTRISRSSPLRQKGSSDVDSEVRRLWVLTVGGYLNGLG